MPGVPAVGGSARRRPARLEPADSEATPPFHRHLAHACSSGTPPGPRLRRRVVRRRARGHPSCARAGTVAHRRTTRRHRPPPRHTGQTAPVPNVAPGPGIDRIVVHSRNQLPLLHRALSVPASTLQLVPYGVDTAFWTPARRAEEPDLVVSVGREHRDYDTLLAALPDDGTADHRRRQPVLAERKPERPDAMAVARGSPSVRTGGVARSLRPRRRRRRPGDRDHVSGRASRRSSKRCRWANQ